MSQKPKLSSLLIKTKALKHAKYLFFPKKPYLIGMLIYNLLKLKLTKKFQIVKASLIVTAESIKLQQLIGSNDLQIATLNIDLQCICYSRLPD